MMRSFVLLLLTVTNAVNANNFDENILFLIEKINTYVKNEHNNDYKKALDTFDTNDNEKLDSNELWYALKAIDVGTYVTRSVWVKGIMNYFEAVDTDAILTAQLLELTLAI